jgi:hypothetical protein
VLGDPVCRAHVRPGKKVVFGVGSIDAQIMFVGEAPGADEEVQGEPFVGPAGQLLTRMIQAMGLQRQQVYIGNIMNWRPELPTGRRRPAVRQSRTHRRGDDVLPALSARPDRRDRADDSRRPGLDGDPRGCWACARSRPWAKCAAVGTSIAVVR